MKKITKNKKANIAILYALFAIISIAINMLTQYTFFQIYKGEYYIYIGLVLGTGTGLITKYILDKKWIFYYKTKTAKKNLKTFTLYAIMGIITTIIFWGFELGFYYIFKETETAKYIGGIIGLTIGYTTKYFLDKKYVFRK
jgi:putative flippase GtrA